MHIRQKAKEREEFSECEHDDDITRPNFFSHPVVLDSIYYRTTANRLKYEGYTTEWLKIVTCVFVFSLSTLDLEVYEWNGVAW